jgi:hypothetical protein
VDHFAKLPAHFAKHDVDVSVGCAFWVTHRYSIHKMTQCQTTDSENQFIGETICADNAGMTKAIIPFAFVVAIGAMIFVTKLMVTAATTFTLPG